MSATKTRRITGATSRMTVSSGVGRLLSGVAAETLLLRKRAATWVLLGLWAALTAFFAYILPYITYTNASGQRAQELLNDLTPASMVANVIVGFPFFGGAFAIMLGVLSVGSEYGWGTLKTLFTQGPGRLRIFASKLLALGAILIPFVAIAFVIGGVASSVVASQEGATVDWPSAGLLARGLLGGWLILAAWTAFGVMLAVVTRGTALAIGIGILYTLVVEGLFSAIAGQVSWLEPVVEFFVRANAYSLTRSLGVAADATSDNGPGSYSGPWVDGAQAVLVLAVYLVAFLGLSAYLLRRRDISG
jgi:ABC-type transport system involved in multi-copper enzyme maturation permease subunit